MIPKYTKCSRCGESYDPNFFDDCPYCSNLDETEDMWYNIKDENYLNKERKHENDDN